MFYIHFDEAERISSSPKKLVKPQEIQLTCDQEVVLRVLAGAVMVFRAKIDKKIGMGMRRQGELYVFSPNDEDHPWEITSLHKDTRVCFEDLGHVEYMHVVKEIDRRIARSTTQVFLLLNANAELRCIATMIELLHEYEDLAPHILSKTLAEYTGVSTETFGRVRAKFIDESIYQNIKKGEIVGKKHVNWKKVKELYMSSLPQFHAHCLHTMVREQLKLEKK